MTGYVKLPTAFVDNVLPTISPHATKLYVVVLRATVGWYGTQTGTTKPADWITHSQFKKRTGLSSRMVSQAIDELVQHGLLTVTDDRGHLRSTKQSRRAGRIRLWYRVKTIN